MKTILLFLMCVIFFSSCTSMFYYYYPKTQPELGIILSNNPVYYEYIDTKKGDFKGPSNLKKGDTVIIIGYSDDQNGTLWIKHPKCMSIIYNNSKIFIPMDDIVSIKDAETINTATIFTVKKELSEMYWSRAAKFVADNSEMKIQIQNEYLIETYNSPSPTGNNSSPKRTFKITKEITEDGVKFDVYSNESWYADRCAEYMIKGK